MNLAQKERMVHEKAGDYVWRVLSESILNLQLLPGESMSEQEVAKALNVSRTPVREAFFELSKGSLLDIYPQKGTYVAQIDLHQVAESIFLRENLEHAVMELACQEFPEESLLALQMNLMQEKSCIAKKNGKVFFQLDEEFHQIIFAGCGKERIWAMIVQMSQNYNRVRIMNLQDGFYEVDKLYHQHLEIVAAIEAHDWSKGAVAMDEHIHKVIPDLQVLCNRYPEYFRNYEAIKE
ncbi:MAG: GntR family transcriptional regulator [Selenomonas sp.]|uniref:GntR family transcriptional regulator n=1 Tax=Selenomonas sp. TaxID=2053611 RepID=UPI0025D0FA56|nr:GntR family transcriptional regulator [Selenomonas sp.]MCR5757939.1 GntR family transcriptional regulator [Selenomonas sp.]